MNFNKKCQIIIAMGLLLFFIINVNFAYAVTSKKTNNATRQTTNKTSSQSNDETHTVNSKDKSVSNYENTLKSLSIEGYEIYPEFNKNTVDYYVSIPTEITSLNVEAEPEYDTATFKVTGNTKLSTKGESLVKVVVTSKRKISKTYTIHVSRTNNSGLNLSSLSIDGVVLTPSFDKDTYYYTTEVEENNISPFNIKAKANQEDAKVEIVGNDDSLIKGDNLVSVIVSNGENTAVYQIEINIKDKGIVSTVQSNKNNEWKAYLEKARDFILKDKRNLIIFLAIIFILIIILLIAIIKKIKNSKKDKRRQELKKRAI